MKIIESNIIGKKSQEACEDGLVMTDDFISVIDGSTSKTPKHLSPDMKNGRYAMMLISEYIQKKLKADAIIYSNQRKEVWMVGDCQAIIKGQWYDNSKPYEQEIAAKRVALIQQGMEPASLVI